ncbi:MAG TPA: ATP-binding protein [Symbiobacteriaceae bacterium]|nr:ATP-binding protein [Symbiobacteriaceae bacterium]
MRSGPNDLDSGLLEAFVRCTSDGIVILDESLSVMYMNLAAERMTGRRGDEAAGMLCGQVTGCQHAASGQCHALEAFAHLEAIPCVDLQLRSPTGTNTHVSASVSALPSLHGEPRRLVMVLRDVTEARVLENEHKALLQRTLETAKRQKRQADILFRIGREMVSVLDLEQNLQVLVDETRNLMRTDLGVLMLLNQAGTELSMHAWSGHLVDRAQSLTMAPNQGFIWKMVVTGQPGKTENFPHDLGQPPERHPLMHIEQLKSALGQPLIRRGQPFGILLAANRRPQAFTEEDAGLMASVANMAALALENRRLYARLEEAAQQAERQRLAAEIHDGLTQSLYGLSLMLENLEADIGQVPPEKLAAGLRGARRVVAEALADTREIIFDLRTAPWRDTADIVSLTKDALNYFRHETGIDTQLLLPDGPPHPSLTAEGTAQLFRIIQEALVNIRKHAGASRVTVALWRREGELVVTVTDDGRGFAPDSVEQGTHFGLRIMGERAQTLGGWCGVESTPGCGTRVTISIPLHESEKGAAY